MIFIWLILTPGDISSSYTNTIVVAVIVLSIFGINFLFALLILAFYTVLGWPFLKRFPLYYWTVVMSCLSVTLVYCGQMVAWINATWYRGRPRPRSHCVGWDPAPHSPNGKGHSSLPLFGNPLDKLVVKNLLMSVSYKQSRGSVYFCLPVFHLSNLSYLTILL